jgi:hypothetical protein
MTLEAIIIDKFQFLMTSPLLYPHSPMEEGAVINICLEKCDEKCAYMFNVYKNQLSRQTGSRNLKGSKTLPTIWHTQSIVSKV